MRQAYDYWQDQPGNYFSLSCPAITRKQQQALLTYARTAQAFGTGSFINKIVSIQPQPKASFLRGVLDNQKPAAKTPYSPISQISNTLPPVAIKRQRWWSLKRTTSNQPKSEDDSTIAADSQVVSCDRFSHRQAIHICFSSADTKRYLTSRARKGRKTSSKRPAQTHPKPVHPDRQAHQ